MGSSPLISQQKILAASGDNAALQEILSQIAQVSTAQQAVTGTTPAAGPSQSSSAQVPSQATGFVSVLANIYTVRIVNPGASSPLSALQTAQQGVAATALTPLQPVKAIFHQVRASTSPAFNVNSNTQMFGGNTGSAQTLWTLSGLGSGTWYFQFRSSYDGINFNTWKNANSGAGFGGIVDQVTLETAAFSDWALFSLPGKQIMGVVDGFLADQQILGIPAGFNLYSSALLAIAGPNGFAGNGNGVYGAVTCDVDIVLPTDGTAAVGIPDYPVEIRMQYGSTPGGGYLSPGSANVFGFAFNPVGENVKLIPQGVTNGANWVVMRLPGGARIAIGQGLNSDGETIWTPPSETWISPARVMSICSLTEASQALNGIVVTGWGECELDSTLTMKAKYLKDDGTFTLGNPAHWLAIAWELGAPVQTVGGAPFLSIALQGGHSVVIGAGQVAASGTPITLPAGYAANKMESIAIPGGSDNSGNHLRGVQQCSFVGLYPTLIYTDNNNTWGGAVNFMVAAWK